MMILMKFIEEALIFFEKQQNAELEIRTKSSSVKPFLSKVVDNVILAYSLTPASFSQKYENVTINVVVYSGSINPTNPEVDWHNKCGTNFYNIWNEHLNEMGNCFFNGLAPNKEKIKLIGSIPQIKNYKGKDPKYTYGKLYRY